MKKEDILGAQAVDTISGFKGTVTGICRYMNGCTQVLLKPRVGEDGKMPEGEWIDDQQIEIIEDAPEASKPEDHNGGPQPDTAPTTY